MFLEPDSSQFGEYIKQRKVMQWGGLSDPFDEYERRFGKTLELLRFFKEIDYPLSFSTKATWWTEDPRYVELFEGQHNWHVKISIITLDWGRGRRIELGVPSSDERFAALERIARWDSMAPTLRLRPFVIGLTDPYHTMMVKRAAETGCQSVSTEFFCLENRMSKETRRRYRRMSEILGYDLVGRYRRYSSTTGLLRLNRNVKRRFIEEMKEAADKYGIRLYVSDAHFKEVSAGGSCCGLPESCNYNRGQFTEAVVIARKKGYVKWNDIEFDLGWAKNIKWRSAVGYNTGNSKAYARFYNHTLYDMIRYWWNNPKSGSSPYRYFEGVLVPDGLDDEGNIIYRFNPDVSIRQFKSAEVMNG